MSFSFFAPKSGIEPAQPFDYKIVVRKSEASAYTAFTWLIIIKPICTETGLIDFFIKNSDSTQLRFISFLIFEATAQKWCG